MILRVIIGGLLVFALMLAVKQGWILRETGLTGSCSVYASLPGGAQQEKCTKGKFDGLPDLSNKGCTSNGPDGSIEYWECPVQLQSSPAGV
jgi:hypothetical protein